jgi:hypothetical protein
MHPGPRYDLILNRGIVFEKVQVKTASKDISPRMKGHAIKARLEKMENGKKTNYTSEDVDLVALYYPALKKVYLIDADEVIHKAHIYLTIDTNRPSKRTLWAKDYEI